MLRILPYHRYGNMTDLFDEFERSVFSNIPSGKIPAFRADIRDEGDHYLLQADIPGFHKEDIDLDVKEGVLTITAAQEEVRETPDEEKEKDPRYLCRERRYGSFRRSFDISGIQEEGITASYDNGVLSLKLPKMPELAPQTRKIAIE